MALPVQRVAKDELRPFRVAFFVVGFLLAAGAAVANVDRDFLHWLMLLRRANTEKIRISGLLAVAVSGSRHSNTR
jgi:hypothetical protein